MADVEVRDNPSEHRFEAYVDGRLAGFTAYELEDGGGIWILHTEVDDAFEGQGVGSSMVRQLLDRLRDEEVPVRVTCPFVNAWIRRHPEYQELTRR
jgi:uncharacterized protein